MSLATLREEARELRDEAAKLRGVRGMEAGVREREAEAVRLEAVTVYLGQVEKITAKGLKTYEYYFASWKMGGRVVNKYIGSPRKIDPRGGYEEGQETEG